MKKNLHKINCLFIATLLCIHVNAQSRIKKNYMSNEGIPNCTAQKNQEQTFLQSALNGYYFEGFESSFPPAGWQVVDVLDTVTGWNSSVTADFPAAYQGLQSAYCRYEFATPSTGESWLITPQFSVAAGDSLSFQFKLEYFGFAPDSTFILVSTTDSSLSSFTSVLDFYAEGLNYPADSSNWYYKTYSLNAFAGQNIYIAFKNKNDEGDGLFIDNVEMGTRPAAEASTESIDMDNFYPSGTSNPKTTVKNNGGSTQTFNVTMNITGGYTSTKPITLAPQSTAQISFDPWNAMIGIYTVNVQTMLTGDATPANDTLSKTIKVLEPFVNYGWSIRDPLADPSFGASVVTANTPTASRLFTFGGYAQSTIVSETYEYDLAFSTWASASPMPTEVTYAASGIGNGKIFVIGGRTLGTPQGSVQIYDYANDTWTTGNPMPAPVVTAAFASYKDSLVYIFGGYDDATFSGSNAVQVYDMFTDTWSAATSFPGSAIFSSRAGIIKNKIILAGGVDGVSPAGLGTCYVGVIDSINPLQITWTQTADYPTGKISRSGTAVSVDPNSSLVVFAAGNTGGTIVTDLITHTFAYDFSTGTWKLGPDKPTARNLFYMAPIVFNDSVYLVAAGGNPPGTSLFHSDNHEWLNLGYYQFPTGIKENNFVADVHLFPNPATDATTITLHLKNTAHVNITITDVIGNIVETVCDKKMEAGKSTVAISTKNLSKGMYFCVIDVDGKSLTKKIIKH